MNEVSLSVIESKSNVKVAFFARLFQVQ